MKIFTYLDVLYATFVTDCTDLFKHLSDGTIRHIASNKCLRPRYSNVKEGTELIVHSVCTDPFAVYYNADIKKCKARK